MDVDHDGFLEEEDFEALTARWVGMRGWEPGSADYDRMRSIMRDASVSGSVAKESRTTSAGH